jgi:hypothetical protein
MKMTAFWDIALCGCHLRTHRCENLKSHMFFYVYVMRGNNLQNKKEWSKEEKMDNTVAEWMTAEMES